MYQVEKRGRRDTRFFWELADVYNYIRRSNARSKVKAEFIISENGLDIENEQLENSVWAERAVCVKDMENDFDNVTAYLSEVDKQVFALVMGWRIAEAKAEAKAEIKQEASESAEKSNCEASTHDEVKLAGMVIGHDDGGYYSRHGYAGTERAYRCIHEIMELLAIGLPYGKYTVNGKNGKEGIIKFFDASTHAKSYKIRSYDVRQTFNALRKIKKAVEGYA